MRRVVGGRVIERTAASTSQVGRFETEVLTTTANRVALAQPSGKWIDRVRKAPKLTRIVLDAIRLPANDVLQREIEHLLTLPVGRPPKTPVVVYHGFMYQAAGWNRTRRVIAEVEWCKMNVVCNSWTGDGMTLGSSGKSRITMKL